MKKLFLLVIVAGGLFSMCGMCDLSTRLLPAYSMHEALADIPGSEPQIKEWLGSGDRLSDENIRNDPKSPYYRAPEGLLWRGAVRPEWTGYSGPASFYACGPAFILSKWVLVTSGYYVMRGYGTPILHLHGGIDFAPTKGTHPMVLAPMGGKVVVAGWMRPGNDFGNLVVIENDGYQVFLAHLSEVFVTEGQIVTAGQPIGKVGTTGHSSGEHVHFEVRTRERDAPIDPSTVLLPGQTQLCDWTSHRLFRYPDVQGPYPEPNGPFDLDKVLPNGVYDRDLTP